MKKIVLIIILSLFLVGCGFNQDPVTTAPTVIDIENFIEISTVNELKNIEMNKSYILMNDLDLEDLEWEPLGSYSNPYLGIFIGNDFTIFNLNITDKNNDLNGLFAFVKGDIKNLNLSAFNINYVTDNLSFAGGIAGAIEGNIENVSVNGSINITNTKANVFAGLLAGTSQKQVNIYGKAADFTPATITNVNAIGNLTVNTEKLAFVGGLIGKNFNTIIKDNYVEATISLTSELGLSYVGGLIGHNYQGVTAGYEPDRTGKALYVENNLVSSEINVVSRDYKAYVGGLIGYNYYSDLKNNFVLTDISVEAEYVYLSLLVGENWNSNFTNNVVSGELEAVANNENNETSSPYYGRNFGEISISDCYWHSEMSSFPGVETALDLESITSSVWYEDELEWTGIFINKILQLFE